MATYSFKKDPRRLFTRVTAVLIAVSLILQPALGYSQGSGQAAMIAPGTAFTPVLLKGMILDARDPLKLDFIVDSGDIGSDAGSIQEEAQKLVQYFLASMTIPKGELWVNLSPYENDRIIPEALGQTDLGRDLLAQDYLLKQFTASLIYPEKELGKKFWDTVYTRAHTSRKCDRIPEERQCLYRAQ
jgi:hypothetical protein